MARLTLAQTPTVKTAPIHQLVPILKMAHLMALPEKKFSELVNLVENDPLFKKYGHFSQDTQRLFGFKRFPRSKISTSFLEFNENIGSASQSSELHSYLEDKKEIVNLCRRIGMDQFKKFFLYNDDSTSIEDIAQACQLTPDQVQKTIDLVNHVALEEEFQNRNPAPSQMHEHYNKIAEFEKDGNGDFAVTYTSLRYGRGRYAINYEKLTQLKKESKIDRDEFRQIKDLIRTMELINKRKSTLSQILEKVMDRQREYLVSQNPGVLKSLTQLELARELDVHSSTVSRAVYGKSINTPWGEEVPLKVFLVKGPINKIKAAIYNLIGEEEKKIEDGELSLPFRDDEIKNIIQTELKTPIATRTVAKYRSELDIPNIYKRAHTYQRRKETP